MLKTHVDTLAALEQLLDALRADLAAILESGKEASVTVADEDEELSPTEAGKRLRLSRQHVRRLIDAGELEAHQLPNSSFWKIPLSSVVDLEERRAQAREHADEHARELDRLGAPLE